MSPSERVKYFGERAERVIAFIELLIVPSGKGQGKPFVLRDFQKNFIRAVYAPHELQDGQWRRVVRRAVLSIARKNGKTALIAALVLVHLIGPESIQNGEIYSAANDREQAAQVYKMAAQIVRADADLSAMLRCVDSTKTIVCMANGSFYRALSAEAGTKHGLNPTFVVYDELAQSKSRELYDVLDTAMGAREEPLFATISTQSNDPQHILSQLIDDGLRSEDPTTITHLYAVDDECEDIFDEAVWKDANPALGEFRLIGDVQAMADRAKRLPAFESTFRNLFLNQRVDVKSPLIARATWLECKDTEAVIEPGERIYLALDLSGTTDLSSLVAVSADDGDRVMAWHWKPERLVDEHCKRDRVPYDIWIRDGHLYTTPGAAIDYDFIAAELGRISAEFQVLGLAFDRWRIQNLIQALEREGVTGYVRADTDTGAYDGIPLIPWGQGFRDMGPAVDALETSIIGGRFRHTGNPVLTWCFSNAVSVKDPSGNRKLDKSKARFRIDGAVAAAMAVGLKYRENTEPEQDMKDFLASPIIV